MTVTKAGSRPTSSCASRSAAAMGLASELSSRPPGKLIWPAWCLSALARWVNSTVADGSRSTMGISTAAGTRVAGMKRSKV